MTVNFVATRKVDLLVHMTLLYHVHALRKQSDFYLANMRYCPALLTCFLLICFHVSGTFDWKTPQKSKNKRLKEIHYTMPCPVIHWRTIFSRRTNHYTVNVQTLKVIFYIYLPINYIFKSLSLIGLFYTRNT